MLALPGLAASLLVLGVLAVFVGVVGFWLLLLWLAVGIAMVAFPPADNLVATVLLKYRRPVPTEMAAIQAGWGSVIHAAGVDGSRFSLWVQDVDQVNASAGGGRLVAVTRGSLRSQPPHQLAGVLAHELGHHLGGHPWVKLLAWWYSLPGILVLRAVRVVVRMVLAVAKVFSVFGYLGALAFFGLAFIAALISFPPLALVYVIPVVAAWSGRLAEFRADRVAAEIGFGSALIESLTMSIAQGQDDQRRKARLLARVMATHPPLIERVRRLEQFEIGVAARRGGHR